MTSGVACPSSLSSFFAGRLIDGVWTAASIGQDRVVVGCLWVGDELADQLPTDARHHRDLVGEQVHAGISLSPVGGGV
jgi:hypothetical protein